MFGRGSLAAAHHGKASIKRGADQLAAHATRDAGYGDAERIGRCHFCHVRRYSEVFPQGESLLNAGNKFVIWRVLRT